MHLPLSHSRARVALLIAAACCLGATPKEMPRPKTLEDYPAAIVEHILADFEVQRDTLRDEGAPDSVHGLIEWCACPEGEENAYPLYQEAFAKKRGPARLRLLADAAARPCFAYPLASWKMWVPFFNYSQSEVIDLELFGQMRDATRLLAEETQIRLSAGDTEGAVDMLSAGFGLLDHMTGLPSTLMQLTRYACQDLVFGVLRDTLASVALTDGQLKQLGSAIDRARHPDALARTWIFERVWFPESEPFESSESIYVLDALYQAQLVSARTAIAVERYRLAHGSVPAALDHLVPEFLESVPVDPVNGAPLQYATNETHYAVFSVGQDGVACEAPFAWTKQDHASERTMFLVPLAKTMIPLRDVGP